MAYNYATINTDLYDQRITQLTMTSELVTPNIKWLEDGQSFIITTIKTSGYQPHTRDKGYNKGTISNEKNLYTIEFDRDIEFFVDEADVMDTHHDLDAFKVTNNFIKDRVAPELDAYRFSKMAQAAITNSKAAQETISKDNVYGKLKAALLPIRRFGTVNIRIYVSSDTMDALEQSTSFSRSISVQNVPKTKIETRVSEIDGVQIIEIWDEDRFGTKYDFSDGFELAPDGSKINFIIVAKPAIIAQQRITSIYLTAPGVHLQGDGWLYQNRMQHDLWVLEKQKNGLYVSYAEASA